ncbi:MAG: ATP-binding cassette domain-containing protein [Chitinispirillales bacterium]|jgi:oligopeptide transport system ATP-binding protein|nr:ATP-binding cassette domain-containing protein [Chitinispirillales bacterium]
MLELKNITVDFSLKNSPLSSEKQVLRAVDNVSLKINDNEVLGLVGESGCGKTTLGKTAIRLINPASGRIILDGNDITDISFGGLKKYRSKMQIIFQDPISSLNPRQTIFDILEEPLKIHTKFDKIERKNEIERLIDCVGIAKNSLNRYPHQFSGGQCQRISIARALSVKPKLIIADEPVSSLDVSIQAQILNLMQDLKNEFMLSYLFISHDLAVINHIADRVAVMYMGKIVEEGDCEEVVNNPKNEYTKILLDAVPRLQ